MDLCPLAAAAPSLRTGRAGGLRGGSSRRPSATAPYHCSRSGLLATGCQHQGATADLECYERAAKIGCWRPAAGRSVIPRRPLAHKIWPQILPEAPRRCEQLLRPALPAQRRCLGFVTTSHQVPSWHSLNVTVRISNKSIRHHAPSPPFAATTSTAGLIALHLSA